MMKKIAAPTSYWQRFIQENTHLFGGSAGREGAALQLGGSIGNTLGRMLRFDEKDQHIMIMCGMSAAFSALFGTPMAAAIFSMEVVSVGIMHYAALVPCVVSSLTAKGIAAYFAVMPEQFPLTGIPAFTLSTGTAIAILAILCAGISTLFCVMLHSGEKLYKKYLPNPYLRIFTGGTLKARITTGPVCLSLPAVLKKMTVCLLLFY